MSKILVTGINGFVGKHLAKELGRRRHYVIGVGRETEVSPALKSVVSNYYKCDLTLAADVAKLPTEHIDCVINLAGLAQVRASFDNPQKYSKINVAVIAVLGQKLLEESSSTRLIAVSTGAIYDSSQDMPLTENSTIAPENSPYAKSKFQMEKAVGELSGKGLDCIVVRPFNHIGPGQGGGFLIPDLYTKIEKALKTEHPIEVGNLKTKRDYTDVRDVVKAYADLCEADELLHGVYNVCSSASTSGEKILEVLLKLTQTEDQVEIKINKKLIRKNDPKELYGSYQRLNDETGWKPSYRLEQTLKDFVASRS